MFEKGFLQDVRHNLWEIAGMIFYHALAHEAGIKVVSGGKILRMWKVSLKKETYGGKTCHRITLKR